MWEGGREYSNTLGASPTATSSRFVRACARSGRQAEFDLNPLATLLLLLFRSPNVPFPFLRQGFFPATCDVEVRSK